MHGLIARIARLLEEGHVASLGLRVSVHLSESSGLKMLTFWGKQYVSRKYRFQVIGCRPIAMMDYSADLGSRRESPKSIVSHDI